MSANEPIGLFRGNVFVVRPKGRCSANGATSLKWRPTAQVAAEASGPPHPFQLGGLFVDGLFPLGQAL
jgi:hypothetical protein